MGKKLKDGLWAQFGGFNPQIPQMLQMSTPVRGL
jgi:hypothetical protein